MRMNEEMLRLLLVREYGFCPLRIDKAPRGFYGETFIVEAERGKYLAKADFWPFHQMEYQKSLETVRRMNETKLPFVSKLIPCEDGRLFCKAGDGTLALFEYAEGVHTESYSIGWLFERLAALYRRVPADEEGEVFSLSAYTWFCSLREKLNPEDGVERALITLLEGKQAVLDNCRTRLELFMNRCRKLHFPIVLTHGDAGGNCIVHENGLTIIDWDSVRPSVPERDAWFFMHKPEQTAKIERAYVAAGFSYSLQEEAFAFFCYESFFYYMCENLMTMFEAPPEEKAQRAQKLMEYFDCWIFEQLAVADALP